MEDEEWMGGEGGLDGGDDYSFEDSEQFEDDSICSVATDEGGGGGRRADWNGWEGEEGGREDLPSTSGTGMAGAAAAAAHVVQQNDTSPRGGPSRMASSSRAETGRAASAASTLTLTPSIARAAAASGTEAATAAAAAAAAASKVPPLSKTAAKACARFLTLADLETSYNHAMLYKYALPHDVMGDRLLSKLHLMGGQHYQIPDKIFLSIIKWCFPESEDPIRLYSCLSNGGVDEFNRGEFLYTSGCVEGVMQIGFNLSGSVYQSAHLEPLSPGYGESSSKPRVMERRKGEKDNLPVYNVSIMVDRCTVVSLECSCGVRGYCQHAVALCLFRIHQKDKVSYRTTIWDSINDLSMVELQKFAQYMVHAMPLHFLPTAQKLLDDLKDEESEIAKRKGVPDPTDGQHDVVALSYFDLEILHERVARTLGKFCQPCPTVHCDVQFLSSTPPAIASEWQLLLQPLKSRKPEAIWNLLSIIRRMFRKRDENATRVLHVLTDEILACTHMMVWWLIVSLQQSGRWAHSSDRKTNPLITNYEVPQLCAASICDEMVSLWRVAALNPLLTPQLKKGLASLIQRYHTAAIETMLKILEGEAMGRAKNIENNNSQILYLLISTTVNRERAALSLSTARFTLECFPGFYPALQACHLSSTPSELGIPPPAVTSSLDPATSPFLPFFKNNSLRSPYDVPSSAPNNSALFFGYGMGMESGGTKKRKNKKKMKKGSSRKSARHQLLEEMERLEMESEESGQESDLAGSSQRMGRRKGIKLGPYRDDFDMLFAAAHQPLDGMDLKMARCEALFSHGYTAVAAARAAELVVSMRAALPRLVWNYDRKTESMMLDTPSPCSSTSNQMGGGMGMGVKSKSTRGASSSSSSGSHWTGPPSCSFHPAPSTPTHHGGYGKKRYGGGGRGEQMIVTAPQPAAVVIPQLPDLRVHAISEMACTTLQTALKLVKQLFPSCPPHRHNVFRLLIDVLRLPKGAMSTNQLQVKLFHLESEVLTFLNRMPIDVQELEVIRAEATSLSLWDAFHPLGKGEMEERGVPPIPLAAFIFNCLVMKEHPMVGAKDGELGLGACLAVMGSRHSYPEGVFPMLGECLRRQKGELAMVLLRRYKDDSQKLGLVLDRLLDPTLHNMYRCNRGYHKTNAMYFLERDPIYGSIVAKGERPVMNGVMRRKEEEREREEKEKREEKKEEEREEEGSISSRRCSLQQSEGSWESGGREGGGETVSIDESEESGGNGEDRSSISTRRSSDEGNESSSNSISQSGVAFNQRGGRGGERREEERRGGGGYNEPRFLKKTRLLQPCEAHAHYMFDLAKKIQIEAGGDQSTSIFRHAPNGQGPHRKLLMCSFLTHLYGLGLLNKSSQSWASRTYSTHASITTTQALDIGAAAVDVIRETWSAHFTPSEAASVADKAGQSRDQSLVAAAAQLALSVLRQCDSLTESEGQRALMQCKEQGPAILEQAIAAVEEASSRGEVLPDILFAAAHHWADLHLDTDPPTPTHVPPPPPQQPLYPPPAAYAAPPPTMQQQQPFPHNPYFNPAAAAAGMMQPNYGYPQQMQQPQMMQQVPMQPQQMMPHHPPPMMRIPSRDEDGGNSSASSSASGMGLSIQRPMHASHSAPNLPLHQGMGGGGGGGQMGYGGGRTGASTGPHHLTQYDVRLDRKARAHRLGLKAMEAVAEMIDARNSNNYEKYTMHHLFKDEIIWMYKLSCRMNTSYIISFCDTCTRTLSSPYTLAFLVCELLNKFPIVPYPSLRLASTFPNRPPSGYGQGRFRASALNSGWHPPIADLFDRAMEQAYLAIQCKCQLSGHRMDIVAADEIMEVIQTMRNILISPVIIGGPLLDELLQFTLRQKNCGKELSQKIQSLRYSAHQGRI